MIAHLSVTKKHHIMYGWQMHICLSQTSSSYGMQMHICLSQKVHHMAVGCTTVCHKKHHIMYGWQMHICHKQVHP